MSPRFCVLCGSMSRSATAPATRRTRRARTSAAGHRRKSRARRAPASTPRRCPRGGENNRAAASASSAHDADPIERLDEPHEQQRPAGDGVEGAEEVRIQRRLIEDLRAPASRRPRSAAPIRRSRASRPSAPRRTARLESARRARGARERDREDRERRQQHRTIDAGFQRSGRTTFLGGNSVMLAQDQRRSNRRDRGARTEKTWRLRSLRALAVCVCCSGDAVRHPLCRPQTALTFTKDIAPIIWTRCATCHRPGEIGPFSLLTYDDVQQAADADCGGDRARA